MATAGIRNHGGRHVAAAMNENQHARRHNNFIRGSESHGAAQLGQGDIDKNVVPLPHQIEPGRISPRNQLRQPRVIGVAGEVASFDVLVPETRQEYRHGNCHDRQPSIGREFQGAEGERPWAIAGNYSGIW
jgi:hypothetical protein